MGIIPHAQQHSDIAPKRGAIGQKRIAMRLGVVGLGVIGKAVLKAADSGKLSFSVPVAATRTLSHAEAFLRSLKNPPQIAGLADVAEGADVVMESANGDAVPSICIAALSKGKDVLINSCGALLERDDLYQLARENGARIFIPSGAIIGLDGLKAGAMGRLEAVTITTRKPPASLKGAPYIEEMDIDLEKIREPTVIYEGTPIDAWKRFPANVNVSAAVSFAGIGPRRTRMRIICDPTVNRNIEEVEAEGEFGRAYTRIENVPSENHRTGVLSYLSVLAFLKDQNSSLVVGT